jgi:hypothetical protein
VYCYDGGFIDLFMALFFGSSGCSNLAVILVSSKELGTWNKNLKRQKRN